MKVIRAFVGGKDMLVALPIQVLVLRFVAIHIRPHYEKDRLHSDMCLSSDIGPTAKAFTLAWISDRVCGGGTTDISTIT